MSHITRGTQTMYSELDGLLDALVDDEPQEYIDTMRGKERLAEFDKIKKDLFMKWVAKKYPEDLL